MEMSRDEKCGLETRTTDDQCSSSLAPVAPPSSNVGISHVIPMASSPCTSIPMADSFSSGLWNHQPLISPNMAFNESRNGPATNSAPMGKLAAMSSRGMLFPAIPGFVHPSLSHFPADSAFIERAARLSCFNGGNIGGLINSLGPPPAMATYASVLKDAMCAQQLQKSEFSVTGVGDGSLHGDHGPNTVTPFLNQGDKGSSRVRALNSGIHEDNFTEAGQAAGASSPDAADNSSPSDIGAKKRKRMDQNIELDQVQHGPSSSLDTATKSAKSRLRPEQTSPKSGDKNVKDCSEAPKEDYVHVRARRGQATNSHSLAERVRREKISERMKYLQDLVPGCSKVTGKAVMLDEIINYVQSLQRQVEFLSMKLAAVNPRFDYNIEGLLAKDFLHSRGSSFSTSGFSQVHPQMHAHQQGFGQVGTSGMGNPVDASRKVMTTQMTNMNGYKDPILQMQNPWNEEIHNAMQMTYNANPPLDAQELYSEPNDGFRIGGNFSG